MGNTEANNENGLGQWLNSPELQELREACRPRRGNRTLRMMLGGTALITMAKAKLSGKS